MPECQWAQNETLSITFSEAWMAVRNKGFGYALLEVQSRLKNLMIKRPKVRVASERTLY